MGDADAKKDKGKGKIKQAAGDLTGDDELKREGKVDEGKGGIKEKVSDAADTAREKVDEAASKLRGS